MQSSLQARLQDFPNSMENNPVMVVRGKKTRARNMSIFFEYSLKHKSAYDLSQERKLSVTQIHNIIRWAAAELDTGNKEVACASALTYLNKELQELEEMDADSVLVKEKLKVKDSKLKLVGLRSKIQGILQSEIEIGNKSVNVYFPSFKKMKEKEIKEIKTDNEKVMEEVLDVAK